MTFYDRVNELCRERGISITALALALSFSKGTPSNWKTMTKPPRASTVKKIADYFSVPVDYFYDVDVDVTIQNNNGIIGNTHAPVTINGAVSRETTLLKLADYFGVSVDYLLGKTEQKESHAVNENDIKVALFGNNTNVTDEMWREVLDYAEFIKQKYGTN